MNINTRTVFISDMLEIVTNHWKDDLEWLTKTPYKVVVVSKEGADPQSHFVPTWVIPNKGREASSYLKYIVERYDSLPDNVAFIHGHENAWHQLHDRPLLDIIHAARIETFDYIPLNNLERFYTLSERDYNDNAIAKVSFEKSINGMSHLDICAQFIVSKNRILKNTLDQYKHWYAVCVDDKIASSFEYIWSIIFQVGELYPSKNYFYVATKPVTYFNLYEKRKEWIDAEIKKYVAPDRCIIYMRGVYSPPMGSSPPNLIIYKSLTCHLEMFNLTRHLIEEFKPTLIVRSDIPSIKAYLMNLGYTFEEKPFTMCLATIQC